MVINATTVLLGAGRIAAKGMKHLGRDPLTVAFDVPSVIANGWKWIGDDASPSDKEAQRQVRSVLFQLEAHGYVRSELRRESNEFGTFNKRHWYLTGKGISKLKELSGRC